MISSDWARKAIEDVRDYGISGEDGSIFFQYVEKVVDDNM